MVVRKKEGALKKVEKKLIKGFLAKGWRNQDIQALVNIERHATINSARITEVKTDNSIKPAKDDELDFYQLKKKSYDPQTGLNLYDDERLLRSREAMLLAVQVFNNPSMNFKTEVFSILSNVAWTYLLHEYYIQKKVNIMSDGEHTISLSQMLRRDDSPLSEGITNNLDSIKIIRDEVEHKILGCEPNLTY